jgi:hypothetical protein
MPKADLKGAICGSIEYASNTANRIPIIGQARREFGKNRAPSRDADGSIARRTPNRCARPDPGVAE